MPGWHFRTLGRRLRIHLADVAGSGLVLEDSDFRRLACERELAPAR